MNFIYGLLMKFETIWDLKQSNDEKDLFLLFQLLNSCSFPIIVYVFFLSQIICWYGLFDL